MKILKTEIRTLLATSFGVISMATSAFAGMPDDIRVGARVELEGRSLNDVTVMAMEIEGSAATVGDDNIKGVIQAGDQPNRSITISGIEVVANSDASVEDELNEPMDFSDFTAGSRGKAEGKFAGGVFLAHRMKLKKMKEGVETEIDLGGVVTKVDRAGDSFTLLGIEVLTTPRTVVEVE